MMNHTAAILDQYVHNTVFDENVSPKQILDHLPDGLFTMDKQGRITYFNEAAERITGLSAKDAIGMHCRHIFKTTTCETECAPQKSIQPPRNIYNQEFRVTRLDGKTISINSSISVLKDKDGNVIGGMQVFKDISHRKALEDELIASESKYRRIFESSHDMVFITSKDGKFLDVNQAGVDLLGYANKAELMALPSAEAIYSNPMHRKVFQNEMERQGYVKDFEARFITKDGTKLHCLVTGNAIKSEDDQIIGYEGIIKDITARMDAVRGLQKRNRELSLLNAIALTMNRTQRLHDILHTALTKVLNLLTLDSGVIYLINREKAELIPFAHQGLPQGALNGDGQIRLHDRILMKALFREDLELMPKPTFPPFKVTVTGRRRDRNLEFTCFLITAKEKASGFLALDLSPQRQLTDQDLHLLGSLGNFLGGAIENNRLLRTIRKHREELKELTARLFHSQESERKRIARELHDEAGQALTGINFSLETIEKVLSPEHDYIKELFVETKQQILRTYEEIRRLSHRLHPALLSDLGLEPALDAYLSNIAKHCALKINFRMVGFDHRLPPDLETVIYRISQEALTNTLRHARAEKFTLTVIKSFPNIIFQAEDDGIGFKPTASQERGHALGLLSMRERSAMMGGRFLLRAAPGQGTRIRIEIPYGEDDHA